MNEEYFMEFALEKAEQAFSSGEFPVGCVIADNEGVVATGSRVGTLGKYPNETDHAEITALKSLSMQNSVSCRKGLTLFSTMEPCLMCFGAIILSGITKVVYAYEDVMGGGTSCDLSKLPPLYSGAEIKVIPGVLREKSLSIFKRYFSNPLNDYWKESILARHALCQ